MDKLQFVENAEEIAAQKMQNINPELVDRFVLLIKFLKRFPESCANPRSKHIRQFLGQEEHIAYLANSFHDSRLPKKPSPPATIPDEVVSLVLATSFNIPEQDLERIKLEHRLSMAAENIVGDLLERYLADKLEPSGWIWCSGTSVKAVDFIYYHQESDSWSLLQVKNRDNTENSSSSKIRNNTQIKKWFRSFSTRDATNWENFPDDVPDIDLSETDFKRYIVGYLNSLE